MTQSVRQPENTGDKKARVLVLADWFLPGQKAGGLVTALSNLVSLMHCDYDFFVLTSDRDQGDSEPYSTVSLDCWTTYDQAKVYYSGNLSARTMVQAIRSIAPDLVYLNSYFSKVTIRFLLLRLIGRVPECPVVLAPRGELTEGALQIKKRRKSLYRNAASLVGLYRRIIWHASSELEVGSIQRLQSRSEGSLKILMADEIPDLSVLRRPIAPRTSKSPGKVHFVFLSSILPKKNLAFAIRMLSTLSGDVTLSIFGPIHDVAYWKQCEGEIRTLPAHIAVKLVGPVPRQEVTRTFFGHHFLLLPTLGENFGYVIFEALAAGCPVIISDRTPWRNLSEKMAGWDLPLEDTSAWIRVLQQCVDMDAEEYNRRSQQARSFAQEWVRSTPYRERARNLFETALRQRQTS